MAKKRNIEIEKESEFTEELDKIVSSILPDDAKKEDKKFLLPNLKPLDYEKLDETTKAKATEIVFSTATYYLDENIISIEYVQNKIYLDILSISNLLFQMSTSEHAIKSLFLQIDDGRATPRLYEVLSKLQTSKMEIVKHLKQLELLMENNYKTIKLEYDNRLLNSPSENNTPKQLGSGVYSSVGTKKLLQDIDGDENEEYNDGDFADAEIED